MYDQSDVVASAASTVLKVWQALDCPRRPVLNMVIKCDNDTTDQSNSLDAPFETIAEKMRGIQVLLETKVVRDKEQKAIDERSIEVEKKEETRLMSMPFLVDAKHEDILKERKRVAIEVTKETIADFGLQSTGEPNDDQALFDDGMPAIVDCDPDNEDME
jgi:hypothetical protein